MGYYLTYKWFSLKTSEPFCQTGAGDRKHTTIWIKFIYHRKSWQIQYVLYDVSGKSIWAFLRSYYDRSSSSIRQSEILVDFGWTRLFVIILFWKVKKSFFLKWNTCYFVSLHFNHKKEEIQRLLLFYYDFRCVSSMYSCKYLE